MHNRSSTIPPREPFTATVVSRTLQAHAVIRYWWLQGHNSLSTPRLQKSVVLNLLDSEFDVWTVFKCYFNLTWVWSWNAQYINFTFKTRVWCLSVQIHTSISLESDVQMHDTSISLDSEPQSYAWTFKYNQFHFSLMFKSVHVMSISLDSESDVLLNVFHNSLAFVLQFWQIKLKPRKLNQKHYQLEKPVCWELCLTGSILPTIAPRQPTCQITSLPLL